MCFLGGEPFYQYEFLFELCSKIDKPIGIYTGYDYDEIINKFSNIISLNNVIFLKTGKYEKNLRMNDEYPITKNQIVYLKLRDVWKKYTHRKIIDIINELANLSI